eukprot:3961905-Lingulodinium_polyedra.AAC.1
MKCEDPRRRLRAIEQPLWPAPLDEHERHAALGAFGPRARGRHRAHVDDGVWELVMARRRIRGWRQARSGAAGGRGVHLPPPPDVGEVL